MYVQGKTKWMNCRLTFKYPDYQLGWAFLLGAGSLCFFRYFYRISKIFGKVINYVDFAISKKHKFHRLSKIFREVINYVGFAIARYINYPFFAL